jgi:hypothetical protein
VPGRHLDHQQQLSSGAMAGDLFHENRRHEQRTDGLDVIIEAIGSLARPVRSPKR